MAGDTLPEEFFRALQDAIRADNSEVLAARAAGHENVTGRRPNRLILRQLAPLAIANQWLPRDHATDDDALREIWLRLADGELTPRHGPLSQENRDILQANAATLRAVTPDQVVPETALLKPIPESRVVKDYPVYLVAPHVVALTAWREWTRSTTRPAPATTPATAAATAPSTAAGDPLPDPGLSPAASIATAAPAEGRTMRQRYGESLRTIATGFTLAALVAIPLGLLAGCYRAFACLIEPFTDFFRYMPAPAFGVVLMAIFGLEFAPKVMLVFIGTCPHAILMIAKTTRQLDLPLLEASRTLGCSPRQQICHVVIPGILPNLYNDLRILLGWAWTWLVIAELIGFKSGLTEIIDTRGRRFQFEHVYPAILLIGCTGFLTDQLLSWLSRGLFPWAHPGRAAGARRLVRGLTFVPRTVAASARDQIAARDRIRQPRPAPLT